MPYSEFTLRKVRTDLAITIQESGQVLPDIPLVQPDDLLQRELEAAQTFNEQNGQPIPTIYGSVSSGTAWKFLKLVNKTATIDLNEYPLPPVEQILSCLIWMI